VFDKRIYRAKIKLMRIMSGDTDREEYNNFLDALVIHSNKKLKAYKL
jgi:hypothetical protein